MAKPLSEIEKKQINLTSLQKEDKSITDILGKASHVVVYKFDNSKCQWDRIDVEGSAFVVTASVFPVLRLLVLNRLSPNPYTLDLAQVTKIKLQSPYLMLRLSGEENFILGIWSHEDSDRQTLKDAMESGFTLMASVISKSRSLTPLATPPPSSNVNSNQLKKLLASPKKELVEPSLDSPSNDPDDFMNQLSQNTVSFHTLTHSGGRPISPSVQRYATTPSPPVEDASKTRALAQVLSLNPNSVSKKSTNTTGAITGIAIQQSNSKKVSPSDVFPTDREIGAKSRLSQQTTPAPTSSVRSIDSSALLAPSDLTGIRFTFPM